MSGTPQQQAMPPMREGDIYIVGPDGRMTLLDPMAAMAASSQASSQAAALQQRPTIMYIAAPPGMMLPPGVPAGMPGGMPYFSAFGGMPPQPVFQGIPGMNPATPITFLTQTSPALAPAPAVIASPATPQSTRMLHMKPPASPSMPASDVAPLAHVGSSPGRTFAASSTPGSLRALREMDELTSASLPLTQMLGGGADFMEAAAVEAPRRSADASRRSAVEAPVRRSETPVRRTETPIRRSATPERSVDVPKRVTHTPVRSARVAATAGAGGSDGGSSNREAATPSTASWSTYKQIKRTVKARAALRQAKEAPDRVRFTNVEDTLLIQKLIECGLGNYSAVQREGWQYETESGLVDGFKANARSTVSLKDRWRNIQNAFLRGRVPAHLKLYENEIKQLVEEDRVREKKRGHPTHTAVQTQQRVLRRGPARGKRARRDDSESEDIHASEAYDSEEEEDEEDEDEDEEDEEEDEESAALSAAATAAELEAASKRIVLVEELEEIRQKLAVYQAEEERLMRMAQKAKGAEAADLDRKRSANNARLARFKERVRQVEEELSALGGGVPAAPPVTGQKRAHSGAAAAPAKSLSASPARTALAAPAPAQAGAQVAGTPQRARASTPVAANTETPSRASTGASTSAASATPARPAASNPSPAKPPAALPTSAPTPAKPTSAKPAASGLTPAKPATLAPKPAKPATLTPTPAKTATPAVATPAPAPKPASQRSASLERAAAAVEQAAAAHEAGASHASSTASSSPISKRTRSETMAAARGSRGGRGGRGGRGARGRGRGGASDARAASASQETDSSDTDEAEAAAAPPAHPTVTAAASSHDAPLPTLDAAGEATQDASSQNTMPREVVRKVIVDNPFVTLEEYIRTSDSDMFIRQQQVKFTDTLTPGVMRTVVQYIGSLGLDCGQVEFTWTPRAGAEPRKVTHALPDIPATLSLQSMGVRSVRGTVTVVYSLR